MYLGFFLVDNISCNFILPECVVTENAYILSRISWNSSVLSMLVKPTCNKRLKGVELVTLIKSHVKVHFQKFEEFIVYVLLNELFLESIITASFIIH